MWCEITPWDHSEVAKEREMAANTYLPAYTLLYAVSFTTVVRTVKDHEAFRPLKPYGWRGELWVLWSAIVVVVVP